LLDSCTHYKDYIDKAIELDQKAICFTEHSNIFNWVEKKLYCKEKGIKYLHGVEIYLTEKFEPKVRDNHHTILIARNYDGVKEINKLIDISTQPDHFYYKNRITFDEFLNISDNVIKISACLASPINKLENDNQYIEKLLQKYDYYEIQPHINSEDQKKFNLKLYSWSKQYNKPLIAGTDTHSLNTYKAECRSILQKAKRINYTNEDEFDLTYKSYDELVSMFEQQGILPESVYLEAINNTNVMADSVEEFELDLSFKYPKPYDNEEEIFDNRIEEMYNYKVKNRIISNDKAYLDNIKEEKRVFKKIGMIGFMLFMSELMTWCRENDIPYGPCRGSVGGSTVAYILDITDVDPIKWNTIFSRFVNEDRVEIGDVDIDVSPSQRDLVYQYIIDRFGIDYTSYILAIGTISEKGTIDEIGRTLHFKWQEENPDAKETDSPYHFSKMMKVKSEYELDSDATKEKYKELFYYYDGLLNTAISQSMHPAGIIASPVSLPDNYGTFWNDGKRITQIDMDEIHEVSLVKCDILGLKNIEIIKDTCDLVGINYPLSHQINWEDKNVWGNIITLKAGVFQYEGDYAFSLLKQYKPQKINDLSLVNAALRPSGASYRDRLIAREINKNPSEQIDELLKENSGFLVFQEDVTKFLQDICGLSGSEADNVRRAIGRKDKDRLEKALPQILEGYCNKSDKPREIAEEEAKEFLQIIEDSSEYMFGYNHATGYSMIGYLCAYLRYYYPLEFITAYLNNAQNQDDINDGTELARLKNIKINPIKFGYSRLNYYPDKKTNSVYKGLSSIKGFGEKLDIAKEFSQFSNKNYNTFVDLLIDIEENTIVGNAKIEAIIKLNYFNQFGRNKKLLDIFKEFTKGKNRYNKKHTEKTKQKRVPLLYEFEKTIEDTSLPINEQIAYETELLGTPMSIYDLPRGTSCIIELNTKNSPKIKVYGLATGSIVDLKVYKKYFNKKPFKKGDIVKFSKFIKKPKVRFVGYNSNGKPLFEPMEGEWDIWSQEYSMVSL
jgi:DNA polymerase-3 subunit alpha